MDKFASNHSIVAGAQFDVAALTARKLDVRGKRKPDDRTGAEFRMK